MNETSSDILEEVSELDRLVTASREALTDQMVERLSGTLGEGLELLDRLNDEDTRDAVHALLDELTALHRSGGLKAVIEIVHLLVAMRSALSDSMVERLSEYAENMVSGLASESMNQLATAAHDAMHEAIEETAKAPPSSGIFAVMKLLGDPETMKSLNFLLATAQKLRQSQL